MRRTIALARLGALCALTLGFYLAWIVGLLPALCSRGIWSWRSWIFHRWARAVRGVLGLRVEERGRRPEAPFLLVSNHLSYLDIVLLASLAPSTFVAKSDLAAWPVLGFLARSMGTIFVDRQRKRDVTRVGEAIRRRLESGAGLVVFPDGTSTDGSGVAPFRSSLLEPAAQLELPVHWASLRYETPAGEAPASLSVAWWGDMLFVGHFLGLLRLSRIRARVVFGEETILDPDRKLLAARLHEAVSASFEPMCAGQAHTSAASSRTA